MMAAYYCQRQLERYQVDVLVSVQKTTRSLGLFKVNPIYATGLCFTTTLALMASQVGLSGKLTPIAAFSVKWPGLTAKRFLD